MPKAPSNLEIRRKIFANARAFVNDADYDELLGDEFMDSGADDHSFEDRLEAERRKVLAHLDAKAGDAGRAL